MPKQTPTETVAQIRALRAKGLSVTEIGQGTGVSEMTVRRYLGMVPDEAPRKHESRRPLFDPARDGVPDMPLTAVLCGDPLPGRRDLVAKNRGRENLRLVEPDED